MEKERSALTTMKMNSKNCLDCEFFKDDCNLKNKTVFKSPKKFQGQYTWEIRKCTKKDI